jgi:hypothetical protein
MPSNGWSRKVESKVIFVLDGGTGFVVETITTVCKN